MIYTFFFKIYYPSLLLLDNSSSNQQGAHGVFNISIFFFNFPNIGGFRSDEIVVRWAVGIVLHTPTDVLGFPPPSDIFYTWYKPVQYLYIHYV